ncbi:MAG: tRNA pseudouridine(55) synthase TruB [Eubacterium sp.]|nr:tRNA pseudouridine(55) synthase TruB [Eubacterium sp.]
MAIDGIINIYKDQNITSHDVAVHVRRLIGVRRVGHTGTLDPMATGVLPVCIGRSARVMEYLDTDLKKYRCTMKLGRATNTYDVWGEVLEEASEEAVNSVAEDDVRKVLSGFTGRIKQTPPLYSAVKVKGKRLYEYARKGRDVEIPEREVYITSLEIEDMRLGIGYDSWVRFSCECTKGTFIRSICHDAGNMLGVYGCLSELTRTASGIFTEDDALTLDQLREKLGYTRETEPRRGGVSRSQISDSPEKLIGYVDQDRQDDECTYDAEPKESAECEHAGNAFASEKADCEHDNTEEHTLKLLHAPDDVLGMLGAVRMEPKDALRLINGLEIERSVYTILEEPKYKREEFYFPVEDKYKRLYRIYSPLTENMEIPGRPGGAVWYPERTIHGETGLRFIGLGLQDPENGHLWPEKIFI